MLTCVRGHRAQRGRVVSVAVGNLVSSRYPVSLGKQQPVSTQYSFSFDVTKRNCLSSERHFLLCFEEVVWPEVKCLTFLVSRNLGRQRHSQFKWGPLAIPAHEQHTVPASQSCPSSSPRVLIWNPGSQTLRILAKKYRPYTVFMQHPSRIWGHTYLIRKGISISAADP